MYVEASGTAKKNSVARMYSLWYWNQAQSCVQFYYHMFGTDVGRLVVYIQEGSYVYYRFGKMGNQNNTWHLGQADVKKSGWFLVIAHHLCFGP